MSIVWTVHRSVPQLVGFARSKMTRQDKRYVLLRKRRKQRDKIFEAATETRKLLGYSAHEYKETHYLPEAAHNELRRTKNRRNKKISLAKVTL